MVTFENSYNNHIWCYVLLWVIALAVIVLPSNKPLFSSFESIWRSHKYSESSLSGNIQNQGYLRAKRAFHKRFSRLIFLPFPHLFLLPFSHLSPLFSFLFFFLSLQLISSFPKIFTIQQFSFGQENYFWKLTVTLKFVWLAWHKHTIFPSIATFFCPNTVNYCSMK